MAQEVTAPSRAHLKTAICEPPSKRLRHSCHVNEEAEPLEHPDPSEEHETYKEILQPEADQHKHEELEEHKQPDGEHEYEELKEHTQHNQEHEECEQACEEEECDHEHEADRERQDDEEKHPQEHELCEVILSDEELDVCEDAGEPEEAKEGQDILGGLDQKRFEIANFLPQRHFSPSGQSAGQRLGLGVCFK
jgi:hypothetical protein